MLDIVVPDLAIGILIGIVGCFLMFVWLGSDN